MPLFEVELMDGRKFQVEADTEPTETEVMQALEGQKSNTLAERAGQGLMDLATGAAKGVGSTALGLGELVSAGARHIPGIKDYVATPEQFEAVRQEFTTPTNTAQKVGKFAEQTAEFMVPASKVAKAPGLLANVARQGALGAAVGAAQEGELEGGVVPGIISAAMPVVGKGLQRAGEAVYAKGLRPSYLEAKRLAGVPGTSAADKVKDLTKFGLERNITNPQQAEGVIKATDAAIRQEIGNVAPQFQGNALRSQTDNAVRQLIDRVGNQANGAADIDVIKRVYGQFIKEHLLNPQAFTPQKALEIARATDAQIRNSYGKLSGPETEALKTISQAMRSYLKDLSPQLRGQFATQRNAIKLEDLLERRALQQQNQSPVSLLGGASSALGYLVGGAPGLVAGVPLQAIQRYPIQTGVGLNALGRAVGNPLVGAAGASTSNPDMQELFDLLMQRESQK